MLSISLLLFVLAASDEVMHAGPPLLFPRQKLSARALCLGKIKQKEVQEELSIPLFLFFLSLGLEILNYGFSWWFSGSLPPIPFPPFFSFFSSPPVRSLSISS